MWIVSISLFSKGRAQENDVIYEWAKKYNKILIMNE